MLYAVIHNYTMHIIRKVLIYILLQWPTLADSQSVCSTLCEPSMSRVQLCVLAVVAVCVSGRGFPVKETSTGKCMYACSFSHRDHLWQCCKPWLWLIVPRWAGLQEYIPTRLWLKDWGGLHFKLGRSLLHSSEECHGEKQIGHARQLTSVCYSAVDSHT